MSQYIKRTYKRYTVDEYGRVKDLKEDRYIQPGKDASDFFYVYLKIKGVSKKHYLHRLVAQAYVKNPNKYNHVKFTNGDKYHIDPLNLEWVASSRSGVQKYSKLKPENVVQIRLLISKGEPLLNIARVFKVSISTISRIKNGSRW